MKPGSTTTSPATLYFVFFLALAFLLRFFVVWTLGGQPESDEKQYLEIAREIQVHHRFALFEQPTAHRPPLYPFFLALCGFLSESLLVPRTIQVLAGTGVLALLVGIAARLDKDRRVPLAVLALGAISPAWIASSSDLLSECLFVFLLYGSILLLLKGLEPGRAWANGALIVAGVALGLATLTRSVVLLLPLFWLGTAIVRGKGKELGLKLLVVAMVWAATIIPWTIRNAYTFHAFIPINTMAGIVLYQGLYPDPRGYGFVPWEEIDRVTGTHDEVERNRALVRKSLETYWQDPVRVAKASVKKFCWFWYPFDGDTYGLGSPLNPHTAFVYIFSLLGVFAWLRSRLKEGENSARDGDPLPSRDGVPHPARDGVVLRRGTSVRTSIPETPPDPNAGWVLGSTLLYFILMAILFYGSPRFRAPIEPVLWIVAAGGVVWLLSLKRERREPILVTSLGFILALYLAGDSVKEYLREWISR